MAIQLNPIQKTLIDNSSLWMSALSTKDLLSLRCVSKFWRDTVDHIFGFTPAERAKRSTLAGKVTVQKTTLIHKLHALYHQAANNSMTQSIYSTVFTYGSFVKDLILRRPALSSTQKMIECAQNPAQKEIAQTIQHLENTKDCSFDNAGVNPDYQALVISSQQLTKSNQTKFIPFSKEVNRHKMYDLFGGKAEFEKLPVLDISQRKQGGYLDDIPTSILTAPIMRGTDSVGRIFFVIRAKVNSNGTMASQVFHERYTGTDEWTDSSLHGKFIDLPGYIIDYGHAKTEKMTELADFIKNKGNNSFTVC